MTPCLVRWGLVHEDVCDCFYAERASAGFPAPHQSNVQVSA